MPKPKWVAVFDCDGTLTPRSKSLFEIIDQKLDSNYFQKSQELKKFYFSQIASRGHLLKKEERDWLFQSIELCRQSRFSESSIKHFIGAANLQEAIFREGVGETLEFLKAEQVPVAIVSYGVADFIRAALAAADLSHLVAEIYAAKFLYGDCFQIAGIKPGTEVFPSTKGKFSRNFAKRYRVPASRILAIGDARSDASLSPLKENRFGVAENKQDRKKLTAVMGETAAVENFYPVLEWLAQKIGVPLPYSEDKPEPEIICANPLCSEAGKVCPECGNFRLMVPKIGN